VSRLEVVVVKVGVEGFEVVVVDVWSLLKLGE
jgi:hypothetical protein